MHGPVFTGAVYSTVNAHARVLVHDHALTGAASTPAPGTYIPFSLGPRACLGAAYGLMQSRVVVATLIQQFKLTTPGSGNAPPERLFVSLKPQDCNVLVTPRVPCDTTQGSMAQAAQPCVQCDDTKDCNVLAAPRSCDITQDGKAQVAQARVQCDDTDDCDVRVSQRKCDASKKSRDQAPQAGVQRDVAKHCRDQARKACVMVSAA